VNACVGEGGVAEDMAVCKVHCTCNEHGNNSDVSNSTSKSDSDNDMTAMLLLEVTLLPNQSSEGVLEIGEGGVSGAMLKAHLCLGTRYH